MGYISPTLAVRDMKQTIQFYRDSLGFKIGMTFPDADNPEYADLSKDGMVVYTRGKYWYQQGGKAWRGREHIYANRW